MHKNVKLKQRWAFHQFVDIIKMIINEACASINLNKPPNVLSIVEVLIKVCHTPNCNDLTHHMEMNIGMTPKS